MANLLPPGLSHLCEFIEDCEHIELATRILHLLGAEGPKTSKPYKYIRFIYNRVLLEAPAVRAGVCVCECVCVCVWLGCRAPLEVCWLMPIAWLPQLSLREHGLS